MKMSSVISLTSCIFFDGIETSLAVQWLRLHASNAGDMGSIPDGGNNMAKKIEGISKT